LTNEQIDNLKKRADKIKRAHKDMRYGQSLMVALSFENKFVYEQVQPTESNCFYEEKKIPAFLDFISRVG